MDRRNDAMGRPHSPASKPPEIHQRENAEMVATTIRRSPGADDAQIYSHEARMDALSGSSVFPTRRADLPLSRLFVDMRYQRDLSRNKVADITGSFNIRAIGVLYVARRPSGSCAVLDGQHRLAALKEVFSGQPGLLVPCEVHENLTLAEESELFYRYNAKRGPMLANERFNSRLEAGHPDAINIARIVEQHGLSLIRGRGNSQKLGTIKAVSALEKIYAEGQDGDLDYVLHLAQNAWPNDVKAMGDGTLLGLYWFIARYRGLYDPAHLVKRLGETSIPSLRQKASMFADLGMSAGRSGFSRAVLHAYNLRLATKRLPQWDDPTVKGAAASRTIAKGNATRGRTTRDVI